MGAQRDGGGLGPQHLQRGVVAAGFAQGAPVALGALHHPGVELRGGEGDAARAAGQQVLRQRVARILLREADAVHARRAARLHHVHAGHAAGLDQGARLFAALEAGDDQARRAMRHLLAQQLLLLARVVMRDADECLVSLAAQGALQGLEQVDEQGVAQERNEHRHVRAAVRGEGAGRRVGHVAQGVGSGAGAGHELGGHGALAAQRARHGDGAHARFACDLGQGHAAAAATSGRFGVHRKIGKNPRVARLKYLLG